MSRIHEALKKAEQERATNASNEAAAVVPPLGFDPVQPPSEFVRLDDLRQRCTKPDWKLDPNTIVFGNGNRSSLAAEQFRTLRARLYQLREKHPFRRLLVTSALPREGKTFVAANLARAIVRQHERRALLIDADLRSSRLHVLLGAPSSPGLSEYLRGEANEASIIQCGSQDNLFFIPGGKPVSNPAELLADARLKTLLDRMVPVFDWTILDSPPALAVSDAGALAGLCDGVLLVVLAGSTDFDEAQKACVEFREKNLVGVVLNRAEESAAYAAYSYYSGDGEDKR